MMPLLSFALYAYALRQVLRGIRWWLRRRNRRLDPLYGRGFDHLPAEYPTEHTYAAWDRGHRR